MHKKTLLSLLLTTLCLQPLSIQAMPHPSEEQVVFQIDHPEVLFGDTSFTLATPPQLINNRTFLPLRFLGETLLEATVHYDATSRSILIAKDYTTVELTLDQPVALVNGQEVVLDVAPLVKNGTTLLPMRFLAEQFNLVTTYIPETQHIYVEKKDVAPNTPPTVSFSFNEKTYTVGETLEATIHTDDVDGDAIVNQRWVLNHVWSKPYASLEELSKALTHDFVSISLQVQDARGSWSAWHTEVIVILPNMPPVITDLHTDKKTYAQGEPITFSYTYDNEPFESIQNERWRYRHKDESITQTILEKPDAIFAKGEYIVTLDIQDASGQWSTSKQTVVTITDEVVETEFEYLYTKGIPGTIITNFIGTNFRDYTPITYVQEDLPGTLIMSNSPEAVSHNGILYETTVKGDGRMLFHHINSSLQGTNKRLVIIAHNEGELPVEGKLLKTSVRGPSSDVLFVGQQLLYDYLESTHTTSIYLEPGASTVLYDSLPRNWRPQEVISGMFDFDFSEDVKLTVAALDPTSSLSSISSLQPLEPDAHPRGTFSATTRQLFVTLSDQKEPSKLIIGQGAPEWLVGTDDLTGDVTTNRGNFGLVHRIHVSADEDTLVLLNPRGNMYKGAVKWDHSQAFMIPKNGNFPDGKRAGFLGVVKKDTTQTFTYVLPNGSSAPVLIGFIPISAILNP